MTFEQRLSEAFERGMQNGFESLASSDRDLYLIQDFIFEYELGGLTGYFYNRLPDVEKIRSAAEAMRRCGLTQLSGILAEATHLISHFDMAKNHKWNEVLEESNVRNRLKKFSGRIDQLDNFGLSDVGS